MPFGQPNQSSDERFRRYLLQYSTDEVLSDSLLQSLYSEDTIGKILAKEDVIAADFHNLIRLLLIPNHLLLLQGTEILTALMGLLRQHCQDHGPYDNEYGFYCVDAIMFILGIGVLAESKILQQYIDQMAALPGPKHIRNDYITLGDCVAQFLPTAQRAGTAWGFHSSTQTLSPSLGGFTTSDLRFVVNILWQNRKQMLWAHTIAGTSPGWWYGIYLLWMFNEHTLRDRTLTDRIYVIALRAEVNSSWDKHDLLDKAIFTIRTAQQPRHSNTTRTAAMPVDAEDAKLALSRYYQYIIAYHKRDRQTLGLCIMWAGDLIFWLDNLDVYLEYLGSHIKVLWAGVLREDSTPGRMVEGTVDQATLVFLAEFVLKFTKLIVIKATPEGKYACIRMLLEGGDFINLMGRILLWFTRFDVPGEILEIATTQASDFNASLADLASTAKPTHKQVDRPVPYIINAIMDWGKVAYFLEDILDICTPNNYALYHYLHTAAEAWREFRGMIPTIFAFYCGNPDCNKRDPELICMGCRYKFYCSEDCQAHHWDYRAMGRPHWLQCGTPRENYSA